MLLHPQQAKLKLQRVKNYLELRREELRFKRRKNRNTRPIQKAIAIINKAIKDIDAQYYIRRLDMKYSTIWVAEDRGGGKLNRKFEVYKWLSPEVK